MTIATLTLSGVLSYIGLGWYTLLWVIGLLGCWASRKRYRRQLHPPTASRTPIIVPGVSILRPLKGLDANLYETLESTFLQEYSNYEIIFSAADERDQALSIVRDLITKYPFIDAKIVIGEEVAGVNPKINNLIRPYAQAANDILWILDSNISVDRCTLARAVDILASPQSTIALIHHVPYAVCSKSTFGSRIEQVFLNTNHAKMYVAINTVALESCVVGKSNLYRRSDLDRLIGSPQKDANPERGLRAFGKYLAEDNMIASALWHQLNVRHDLSCDIARNVLESMSLTDYIWRRVRWIRVRRHMVLIATLLEPFTECGLLSLIGCTSLHYLFFIPYWSTLVVHYLVWLFVDLDVYASLASQPVPMKMFPQFLLAWMARELLALPIWTLAMFGNEVTWRGERYRMLPRGEVERVSPDA